VSPLIVSTTSRDRGSDQRIDLVANQLEAHKAPPGSLRATLQNSTELTMPISGAIRESLAPREPGAGIARASDRMLEPDEHLFRADATEQALIHCFGVYLQEALPDGHFDCDYKRCVCRLN
jgi:hypothetical protein